MSVCVSPSADCAALTGATCVCYYAAMWAQVFCSEKSTSRSHDRYAIFMVAELVFYPQGLITCEDANQSSAMAMAVQQQQMQSQGELALMAAAMTPGGAQASTGRWRA